MTVFIILGALMVLAAMAVVLWPLFRSRTTTSRRWPVALATAILLPVLAFGLYRTWSNWSWNAPPAAAGIPPAIAQMVAGLEAKLAANPNDVNGWLMLGRSYFQLNQYPKAVEAYQKAYTLTQGQNVEAILGLGEALAFADERMLTSRSADLFERAMSLSPSHPKALWYSGLAAFQSGRLDIARERWSSLVALDPPPEVKQLLLQKIDEIDAQLKSSATAPAQNAPASPVVKVRISIAPKLADRVPPGAPLFVMVRTAQGGGPPLAATRRDSAQFPQIIELTDRDAMIAGRNLGNASHVTVVARIARSGDPRAQSGDLEGQVGYDVGSREPVDLVIDSIVP